MLTLITGEDLVSSREALVKIKAEAGPLEVVSWLKEQEPAVFLRQNSSPTFLGGKRLLVFEAEKGEKRLESEHFLAALGAIAEEVDVVMWVGTTLAATNPLVKKIHELQGKGYEFAKEVPKEVFPFLEALAARNRMASLKKLQKLLDAGAEPIFLVAMIAYQLRMLLRVKLGAEKSLSSFVIAKAKRNVGSFSEASLVEAFAATLEADLYAKTTQLPQDIVLTNLVLSIVG